MREAAAATDWIMEEIDRHSVEKLPLEEGRDAQIMRK